MDADGRSRSGTVRLAGEPGTSLLSSGNALICFETNYRSTCGCGRTGTLPWGPAAGAFDAGQQLYLPCPAAAAVVTHPRDDVADQHAALRRVRLGVPVWSRPMTSAPPTRAPPIGSVEQDQLSVPLPALRRRNNLRVGRRGSLPDDLRISGVSVAFVGVSIAFVVGRPHRRQD